MMAPQLERAAQMRPDYRFAKINVAEQPELADVFQVRSIPTLLCCTTANCSASRPGSSAPTSP